MNKNYDKIINKTINIIDNINEIDNFNLFRKELNNAMNNIIKENDSQSDDSFDQLNTYDSIKNKILSNLNSFESNENSNMKYEENSILSDIKIIQNDSGYDKVLSFTATPVKSPPIISSYVNTPSSDSLDIINTPLNIPRIIPDSDSPSPIFNHDNSPNDKDILEDNNGHLDSHFKPIINLQPLTPPQQINNPSQLQSKPINNQQPQANQQPQQINNLSQPVDIPQPKPINNQPSQQMNYVQHQPITPSQQVNYNQPQPQPQPQPVNYTPHQPINYIPHQQMNNNQQSYNYKNDYLKRNITPINDFSEEIPEERNYREYKRYPERKYYDYQKMEYEKPHYNYNNTPLKPIYKPYQFERKKYSLYNNEDSPKSLIYQNKNEKSTQYHIHTHYYVPYNSNDKENEDFNNNQYKSYPPIHNEIPVKKEDNYYNYQKISKSYPPRNENNSYQLNQYKLKHRPINSIYLKNEDVYERVSRFVSPDYVLDLSCKK